MVETGILPDADITTEWAVVPTPGTHYTAVDEYVVNTADWVWCAGGSNQGTETFGFPDTINDVDEVTQIVVNVHYSFINADESPAGSITIDVYLGGWLGTKTFTKPHGGWEAFTWAGLSASQADLNGLQVKFYAAGLGAGKYIPDSCQVHAVNVDVTYTATGGPAGWGHKVKGVLPANIGKINGVLTANIGKVNGV